MLQDDQRITDDYKKSIANPKYIRNFESIESEFSGLPDNFNQAELEQIFYLSTAYTLVPEKLFDSSNLEVYFKNLIKSNKLNGHKVVTDILPGQIVLLHLMPDGVSEYLRKNRLEVKVECFEKDFLERHLNANHSIQIYKANSHILISVVKDGVLKLMNNYQVSNNTDVLYYLLLIVEQLGLNQSYEELILFGNVNEELLELLQDYVPNTKIDTNSNNSFLNYSCV